MNKREAVEVAHTLSNTSKMPCQSYGLPAKECKTGSTLRKLKGSTCESCYALKGQYVFRNVQEAQYKRLDSIKKPEWVAAMATLLSKAKLFRWHDSGDLMDVDHFQKIIDVCKATPDCQHWLPTREKKIIKTYLRLHPEQGSIPDNLVIRISMPMVNQYKPVETGRGNIVTSSVHTDSLNAVGFECPASKQNNECRDCRACFNLEVTNVSYLAH